MRPAKSGPVMRGSWKNAPSASILAPDRVAGWNGLLGRVLLACLLLAISSPSYGQADNGAQKYSSTVDIIGADYFAALDKVLFVTHDGEVGSIGFESSEARTQMLAHLPGVDFTALAIASNDRALIGSSDGLLYGFDGQSLSKITQFENYNEPIMDIRVGATEIWLAGASGLLAKSENGVDWKLVEIAAIVQPPIAFPKGQTGNWYLGVANIDAASFKLSGAVDGQAPVPDRDYRLFPEEGMVEVLRPLDAQSDPYVSFEFRPGPPFRGGDISWNTVLLSKDRITLAGEFGLIAQSTDGGKTWIRRNGNVTPEEPAPAYWIAGTARGDQMVLAGAAGAVASSTDGGTTWVRLPVPGKEAAFGVHIDADGTINVAGAVGLVARFEQGEWQTIDRSQENLYSWLKSFVELEDGRLLLLGGKSTALTRGAEDTWSRVKLGTE